VFPTSFTYERASSVANAVALLEQYEDAKILAGGHSLIPAMKLRLAAPEVLVDISRIAELKGINIGDEFRIGAMVTYNEIRDHAELSAMLPILAEAINVIGDQQVRARGTLGGAIAHADPAADLTAVFEVLNGRVKVIGPSGDREIKAEDLFVDLWTTTIEPNEVLTEVIIPRPIEGTKMAYAKHAHPASGYAVVGVAVALPMVDGNYHDARIVLTGATSRPTRLTAAEGALNGATPGDEVISSAASVAAQRVDINGDTYASEEFRAHLIQVMTGRALEHASSR
jgi:carbon-monoxide dehydrogenase medium subunit